MPLRLLAALLGATALLAVPSAAQANPDLLSLMQDDDLLVYRSDATRDRALQQMKGLGADGVRVTLLWEVVAEDARETRAQRRRFARLGADDPRAYPRLNWDRYDRLVRAARNLGLTVLFNVTGPGPRWAHAKPPRKYRRHARTWRPRPRAFHDFVRAVGTRYSGAYRDENDGRVTLPEVRHWSIWNEPNQGGWLTPQFAGTRRVSPALYRELFDSARRALAATGHDGDTILAGETAPAGVKRRTVTAAMSPKTFIRDLFCVDSRGRPRRGTGCDLFDKRDSLRFTAWAHHPYTKNVSPLQRASDRNAITMANIGELPELLDQIAAGSSRVAAGTAVISTEFGFESNPPDTRFGVPLATQAAWNVLGDFIAAKHPRVIGTTQFLLRDVAPNRRHRRGTRGYWLTYQSGLFGRSGTAKPAATAWAFPFLAVGAPTPSGTRNLYLWGMLRFRPNAPAQPDEVVVQWRPAGSGPEAYRTIGEPIVVTSGTGLWEATREVPGPGFVRAVWTGDMRPGIPIALPQEIR